MRRIIDKIKHLFYWRVDMYNDAIVVRFFGWYFSLPRIRK